MKWLSRILAIVFIFGIGWMFGLFLEHWPLFVLSFEVPAFNIVNLLVISFLAWYVNYTIQNESRKSKAHIDLLSGKIDELDANLKRIVELCIRNDGASYTEICNLDKRNRKWAKTISETVEKRYSKLCNKEIYDTLESCLMELRKLLTTIPIMTEGCSCDVIIKDSIVSYSNDRRANIETLAESIRHMLFNIKLAISQK